MYMLSARTLLSACFKAACNTIRHDGIEHAGYLAFLGLIALFPFLVFVVALAGFVGEGQAGMAFIHQVLELLPPGVLPVLKPRIAEIVSGPPQGLLTVSILGAIWTASSAVEGYRTVLNRAYHVGTPPAYIWRRLLSIVQMLLFSFCVVGAMMIVVFLPIAWEHLSSVVGRHHAIDVALQFAHRVTLLSIAVMFVAVCGAYYVIPNMKQNWHSVVPGAALVTVLWMVSAQLLTYYLSQFQQVNLIYGSLGGIIAVLLFFYISNIIFIYGAEFNSLVKEALGEKIEQKEATASKVNHS